MEYFNSESSVIHNVQNVWHPMQMWEAFQQFEACDPFGQTGNVGANRCKFWI